MTGILNNTSNFDAAVDYLQSWEDGVTEVLAEPLNHLSDVIENTEAVLLARFGSTSGYRPSTNSAGDAVTPVDFVAYAPFSFTTGVYGVMPYKDGANMQIHVYVRLPFRWHGYAIATLSSISVLHHGVSQAGWSAGVAVVSAGQLEVTFSKAINGTDTTQMGQSGYAVTFTASMTIP